MRISRLILSGAAIGTIIGTGRADLNSTHVFNPAWPPHARFHNATGWGTVAGSQLLALWLLWRPGQQASDHDTAVTGQFLGQHPAQLRPGAYREQPPRVHHDNLPVTVSRYIECRTHRPPHSAYTACRGVHAELTALRKSVCPENDIKDSWDSILTPTTMARRC